MKSGYEMSIKYRLCDTEARYAEQECAVACLLSVYPESRFTVWLLQEAENKILSDITH